MSVDLLKHAIAKVNVKRVNLNYALLRLIDTVTPNFKISNPGLWA